MKIVDEAYRASVASTIAQIAEALQTTLGQRLTAYAVGVRDPKAIGKYARGAIEPREDTAQRLLYERQDTSSGPLLKELLLSSQRPQARLSRIQRPPVTRVGHHEQQAHVQQRHQQQQPSGDQVAILRDNASLPGEGRARGRACHPRRAPGNMVG